MFKPTRLALAPHVRRMRPPGASQFGWSQRLLTFVAAFMAAALVALLVWTYAPAKTVLMFSNKECEGSLPRPPDQRGRAHLVHAQMSPGSQPSPLPTVRQSVLS